MPLLAHKASGRTAALFVAWIQAVEAACTRALEIECPGCGGLAMDAQRLIMACGISAVAPRMAEAVLTSLLLDTKTVVALAKALNVAMAADGWPLPARQCSPRPAKVAPRPTAPRTLH